MSSQLAGLILAGGESRRLGRPKQMLPYGDGTLLEHAIAEAEAVAELNPVLAVLPPDESRVPDPRVRRARIVRRREDDGCSSSLHAGLHALPPSVPALAVLPADQPDVTSELISLAVGSWIRRRPPALALSYRGQLGHPLIFATSLLDQLRDLHGDKALWRLLERLGEAVERIEVDRALPRDVDTWDDYERIMARG